MFLVAIVGVAILITMGLGGFYTFRMITRPDTNTHTNANPNIDDPGRKEPPVAKEVGHYWLELWSDKGNTKPVRVAGVVPLPSGQAFKFHFVFADDGYLYIVGPGMDNKPTAFLTDRPPEGSGLDSNRVVKGVGFSFPKGAEQWVELDKKPGTESYTVVFSPTPLDVPAFLSEQATGDPLTQNDEQSWNDFLSRSKITRPVVELNNGEGSAPFVTVKLPETEVADNPIIFEIRIQHK